MFWNKRDHEVQDMIGTIQDRLNELDECHHKIEQSQREAHAQVDTIKKNFKSLEEFVLTSISRANNAIDEHGKRIKQLEEVTKEVKIDWNQASSSLLKEKINSQEDETCYEEKEPRIYYRKRGRQLFGHGNSLGKIKEFLAIDDRFISCREAGDIFHVSDISMRILAHQGIIPSIVIKRVLVKESNKRGDRRYVFFEKEELLKLKDSVWKIKPNTYTQLEFPFRKGIMRNK